MRERLRQFREAGATPVEADWALASEWLETPLYELFAAQHPRDIVHAANTARWLIGRGQTGRDLIVAALLHDVAKAQQRRRDRVAFVVLDSVNLAGMAASANSRFELRRALERTRTHSAAGAKTLLEAGAPVRAVELTRLHHAADVADPVLALLQRADAAS